MPSTQEVSSIRVAGAAVLSKTTGVTGSLTSVLSASLRPIYIELRHAQARIEGSPDPS